MNVTVVDTNGDPVQGATVVAVHVTTQAVAEATTNASGVASLSLTEGDDYEVYAVHADGRTTQASIRTEPVSGGGGTYHEIVLGASVAPLWYYRFEETGTETLDNATGDATYDVASGSVTDVTRGVSGAVGNAFSFNGASSRITLPTSALPSTLHDGFTFAVWIKTSYTGGGEAIMGADTTADNGALSFVIYGSGAGSGTAGFNFDSGAAEMRPRAGTAGIDIRDGGWHSLVFAYNGDDTADIYIDGVQQTLTYASQTDITATPAWDQGPFIGGVRNPQGNVELPWNGELDEPVFVPGIWTQGDVDAYHDNTP